MMKRTAKEIIDDIDDIEHELRDKEGDYIPSYYHHWSKNHRADIDKIVEAVEKEKEKEYVAVDEILKDLEKIGKLIPFIKSETLQEERNVSIKVACEIRKLTKILKGERR